MVNEAVSCPTPIGHALHSMRQKQSQMDKIYEFSPLNDNSHIWRHKGFAFWKNNNCMC